MHELHCRYFTLRYTACCIGLCAENTERYTLARLCCCLARDPRTALGSLTPFLCAPSPPALHSPYSPSRLAEACRDPWAIHTPRDQPKPSSIHDLCQRGGNWLACARRCSIATRLGGRKAPSKPAVNCHVFAPPSQEYPCRCIFSLCLKSSYSWPAGSSRHPANARPGPGRYQTPPSTTFRRAWACSVQGLSKSQTAANRPLTFEDALPSGQPPNERAPLAPCSALPQVFALPI